MKIKKQLKRILLFLTPMLTFGLLLSSCNREEEAPDTGITTVHLGTEACISDGTVYFISDIWVKGYKFLMYADAESGVGAPLCGKAECLHEDGTCNACLSEAGIAYGLGLYDGKLYWIADKYTEKKGYLGRYLYSIQPDGNGRSEVRQLMAPENQNRMLTGNNMVFYTNGYVVECGNRTEIEAGETKDISEINTYSLSGKGDMQLYHRVNDGYGRINMVATGGELYYMITGQKKITEGEGWTRESEVELCKYSFMTEKTENLYQAETDFFPWEFMISEKEAFLCSMNSGTHPDTLYKLDLEGGTLTELYEFEYGGNGTSWLIGDGLFRREFRDGSFEKEYTSYIGYDGSEKGSWEAGNLKVNEVGNVLIGTFIGEAGGSLYMRFTGYGEAENLPEFIASYGPEEPGIVWANEASERLLSDNEKKLEGDIEPEVWELKLRIVPEQEEMIVIHDLEEANACKVKVFITNNSDGNLLDLKMKGYINGVLTGNAWMDHFPEHESNMFSEVMLNQLLWQEIPETEGGVTVRVEVSAVTETGELLEKSAEIFVPVRVEMDLGEE